MAEPRKKPSWAFWTALAIALPIFYVVSFGPACWITSRLDFGVWALQVFYWPLTWAMRHNATIAVALAHYAQWGASDGWAWINDQSMLWWANLRG